MRSLGVSVLLMGSVVVGCLAAPSVHAEDIRVTVIAILATTEKGAKVDPEVEAIANAIRKSHPEYVGFSKGRATCQSVTVGKEETFPLVDKQKATVLIEQGKDKKDMIRVIVKPPTLNEVTMTCCCGKFVPFMTLYDTKDKKERLIIAVMVNPCPCPK